MRFPKNEHLNLSYYERKQILMDGLGMYMDKEGRLRDNGGKPRSRAQHGLERKGSAERSGVDPFFGGSTGLVSEVPCWSGDNGDSSGGNDC